MRDSCLLFFSLLPLYFLPRISPLFIHPSFPKRKLITNWLNTKIYQNVQKDINIKYPESGKSMEFDFWIPQYNLCFEFQVFTFYLFYLLYFSILSLSSFLFLSWFILSYFYLIEEVKVMNFLQDSYHYISTWYYQNTQSYIHNKDSISLLPSLPSLLISPSLPPSLPFFSCSHFERIRYQKSDCQSSWDELDCYSLLVEWSRTKVLLYFFLSSFIFFYFLLLLLLLFLLFLLFAD